MNIGVVREIKNNENRVAVVPSGVETLTRAGHRVFVETNAGVGTSLPDDVYQAAGAAIVPTAADVWSEADIICKVKEPQPEEYPHIRADQTVFTYFHFAASRALSEAMRDTRATCIAYETVEAADHTLPLLTPMSEIAGKMAMQEAAKYLEKPQGGRGILLGGIPGVPAAHVVILGAAWSASTPPRSRRAWEPPSPSWMSTWSACVIWTTCCPRMSRPISQIPCTSARSCRAPMW